MFITEPASGKRQTTGPYGFCLAFACIFNCMLRGIKNDTSQLFTEAEDLVKATFVLSDDAQANRPLAAGHMILNLTAAWTCARDGEEEVKLQNILAEYTWDFRRDADAMWPVEDLETLRRDLQFQTEPDAVEAARV